jgi:AraC-like DNA-binding protein
MLLLSLMLIFGSATTFVLIAGLALRDNTKSLSRYLLIALCLSLTASLLMQLPHEWGGSALLRYTARFFDLPSTGLLWWFLLSLLNDDFKVGRLAWMGMMATLIPAIIFWLEDMGITLFLFPGVNYLNPIIFSALLLHILWVVLTGLKDDLVANRREARLWIVAFITFAAASSVIAGYTLEGQVQGLLRGSIVFAIALFLLFWVTRFQSSSLEFETSTTKAPLDIDPKYTIPYNKLTELMEKEKVYLEPELSISDLADRLGIPSHQLRRLINEHLNYRNFSAFLASYRIADAKRALADIEQVRTPITTIALSSGFASLTTFSRTFKAEVGQTAGDYRQVALKRSQSV